MKLAWKNVKFQVKKYYHIIDDKQERRGKKMNMNKEEKLAKAIAFAAEKHANQKRKDGTPYIFHPLTVAELLNRYGYDIDYQVAGVLHDVLEDTDATDEEVRAFGEDVYKAVKLVTRPKGADEAEYVKNILTNHMAAAVKNADKIHNMYDIVTTNSKSAIVSYAKKVEKYYEGKFSYALDKAIGDALYESTFCDIKKEVRCRIPDYTMEEMKLYSDRRKEAREKAYRLYKTNKDIPNLNDKELKFAVVDYVSGMYCYLPGETSAVGKTWELTKGGWKNRPNDNGSIFACYGFDVDIVTKEYFIESIEYLFSKNWFYNFVEKEKILLQLD